MKACFSRGAILASIVALTAWPAAASAAQSGTTSQSQGQAGTAATDDTQPPKMVSLGDLEEHPDQYVGKRVRVSREVQNVLGPRLFSIDEANWIDLDGETLVYVPAPLAAYVTDDEPTTVTGTVRLFRDVPVQNEWGWLDPGAPFMARMDVRPVIVASGVTTPEGVMLVERFALPPTSGSEPTSTGTSGATNEKPAGTPGPETAATTANPGNGMQEAQGMQGRQGGQPSATDTQPSSTGNQRQYTGNPATSTAGPVTDAGWLGRADDRALVGRKVQFTDVRVQSKADDAGFWIGTGDSALFVLPSGAGSVAAGDTVSIDGTVMQMPRSMQDRLGSQGSHERIYVFARSVKK